MIVLVYTNDAMHFKLYDTIDYSKLTLIKPFANQWNDMSKLKAIKDFGSEISRLSNTLPVDMKLKLFIDLHIRNKFKKIFPLLTLYKFEIIR